MATKLTIPQFRQRVAAIGKAFPKAIIAGMRAGLLIAQRVSKREFILDRSGPPLRPPGPLTNRSGRLRSSIRIMEPRRRGNEFVGGLIAGGSRAPYARFHERGTRRMGARPFQRPALKKAVPQIEKQVGVALQLAFDKGLKR